MHNNEESWEEEGKTLLNPHRKRIRKIGKFQKETERKEEASVDK